MGRIPVGIRSALALEPSAAPARAARLDAVFPGRAPGMAFRRRRYYAELAREGELHSLPLLAVSLEEAEQQAQSFCRGRGYRLERVDPVWDAEEIAGRLVLRADIMRAAGDGAAPRALSGRRAGCSPPPAPGTAIDGRPAIPKAASRDTTRRHAADPKE